MCGEQNFPTLMAKVVGLVVGINVKDNSFRNCMYLHLLKRRNLITPQASGETKSTLYLVYGISSY